MTVIPTKGLLIKDRILALQPTSCLSDENTKKGRSPKEPPHRRININRLTLAVLVTGTGSAQTVLFAFLLAGIAGQETGLLQNSAERRIKKKQSTADAMTHSLGLAGRAAATHVDADFELVLEIHQLEGLAHDHLKGLTVEIFLEGAAVHNDGAGSGVKTGAGSGSLAAPGSVMEILVHDVTPYRDRVRGCGF